MSRPTLHDKHLGDLVLTDGAWHGRARVDGADITLVLQRDDDGRAQLENARRVLDRLTDDLEAIAHSAATAAGTLDAPFTPLALTVGVRSTWSVDLLVGDIRVHARFDDEDVLVDAAILDSSAAWETR